MARSQSSVRRWLEELRYETESYDPHMQMQQTSDATTTVACRYARASWSPQITETASSTLPEVVVNEMPSNRVDTITNKVRNVIAQNEERIQHLVRTYFSKILIYYLFIYFIYDNFDVSIFDLDYIRKALYLMQTNYYEITGIFLNTRVLYANKCKTYNISNA